MQYNNIHQTLGKKKKSNSEQLTLNMKISVIQPKVNSCSYIQYIAAFIIPACSRRVSVGTGDYSDSTEVI